MTRNNHEYKEQMTLPDLDIPPVIDRQRHDFRTAFYEPCLSVAEEYCRGVGYFTTQWFREAAAGMAGLVANGGSARWVVSPVLSKADVDAIQQGYTARNDDETIMDLVEPQITSLQEELAVDTRNTVGWLVAEGFVDIRVALPTDVDDALYHDKFGIITDHDENRLSFHGSMNDTGRAFRNVEAYTTDGDWHGPRDVETVDEHATRFERLWRGDWPGIRTIPLPEAAKAGLLDLRTTDRPTYHTTAGDGAGDSPAGDASDCDGDTDGRETITLRKYQRDALAAWVANNNHGIIEMATGLGKTITAMAAIDRYTDSLEHNLLVVVAVPESYLGQQWAEELADWGFETPVMAYGSANQTWAADLSGLVTDTELGIVSPGIAITTHDSFYKQRFREHIQRANVPCMLIADEVHGVGTETRQQGLIEAYAARMGLSATPQRYMDHSGTKALESYFGGSVFEYGLAEGVPEYLAPYEYYPVVVELTDREAETYIEESQRLAAAISSDETDDEVLSRLSQQRAEIAKTASRKQAALRRIIDGLDSYEGMLVFTHHRQLDGVTETLHDLGIKYHQYTQHEGPNERSKLIDSFSRSDGGLDALVGIHCLDEGVDVSSAQTAILLASTGNPRQFVQRRGRVLRQHEGKERAQIYDLIVVPPRDRFDDLLDSERSLLLKQLERHTEFAETAQNSAEARRNVREVRAALED